MGWEDHYAYVYGEQVAEKIYNLFSTMTVEDIVSSTPKPKHEDDFALSKYFHREIYDYALWYLWEKKEFDWKSLKPVIYYYVQQYRTITDK